MSDDEIFVSCVGKLLDWYEIHARVMPWRMKDPDPYWTLVSEVMLQQTRVETVIPYFQRFIRELPDLQSLSEADEELLMKLWEGLGYYSRVRNLQKAACAAVERFQGKLPSDPEDLRSLPGIGEYTSGAIASIAFHLPVPAVDGNVLRVAARLLDYDKDILQEPFRKYITELLRKVYPADHCSEFTQSLMDLGATVCIPGQCRCQVCPLQEICKAFQNGRASLLPLRLKKITRKIEKKSVLILRSPDSKTAIRKRPAKGVLAKMWELPSLEGFCDPETIEACLKEQSVQVISIKKLKKGKHIFTHLEWHMEFYLIQCRNESGSFIWADDQALTQIYSLPSAFRKFLPED